MIEHLRNLEKLKEETDFEKGKKEGEYKDVLKHDAKIRNIYTQIFEKEDKKSQKEKWAEDPQFQNMVIKLDPYYELDKIDAKNIKNGEFQTYEEEIDRKNSRRFISRKKNGIVQLR